jgi:hypothetical protein
MELEELIRFENENTGLDFKSGQYPTPAFEALIKDIVAMANAHFTGDRYIVCGVKHLPDVTQLPTSNCYAIMLNRKSTLITSPKE